MSNEARASAGRPKVVQIYLMVSLEVKAVRSGIGPPSMVKLEDADAIAGLPVFSSFHIVPQSHLVAALWALIWHYPCSSDVGRMEYWDIHAVLPVTRYHLIDDEGKMNEHRADVERLSTPCILSAGTE